MSKGMTFDSWWDEHAYDHYGEMDCAEAAWHARDAEVAALTTAKEKAEVVCVDLNSLRLSLLSLYHTKAKHEGSVEKCWHSVCEMETKRIIPDGTAILDRLSAAEKLAEALTTCHICGATLMMPSGPIHCLDCSSDCDNHEGECLTPEAAFAAFNALAKEPTP